MSKVFKYIENGWAEKMIGDPDVVPYLTRRNELSLQCGCILWGSHVVIPVKLRYLLLEELHSTHSESSRMKELARSYIWWPNLDKDLEEVSKSCADCLAVRSNPPKADLHPWNWPSRPWHRLHVDYGGPVNGRFFFVLVDAHSKWVDVYNITGTSARDTIECLTHSFATFGLPVSITSDNGPCFRATEFKDFLETRGILHSLSAVYHPSTNGLAEKMVETLKKTAFDFQETCKASH